MGRSADQIRVDLIQFLQKKYPEMEVRVRSWSQDPARIEIQFIDERFRELYPKQRYHQLRHLIPAEYYDEHLADTIWQELAPGEEPDTDPHLEEDTIAQITPDVMACLSSSGFFSALDNIFSPADGSPGQECRDDFRHSKLALSSLGFAESDFSDVFDVLMEQGGFCDCEILYNVAESSRLKAAYWRARASSMIPDEPHKRK